MGEDGFILLGIAAILTLFIGSILGIFSFVRTGRLRDKISRLERELRLLQSVDVAPGSGQNASTETVPETTDPSTSDETKSNLDPSEDNIEDDGVAEELSEPDAPAVDENIPEPAMAARSSDQTAASEDVLSNGPDPAQKPKIDTESTIGGKISIWIGGLTLAIGGLYLAKYSIDAGLLGPRARTTLGFVFGLALALAGEWTRRRPDRFSLAGFENANIPAILSGAGIFIMFGAVYAAHALYGLIGPTLSFIVLAILALISLAISLLHGPILASIGLLASYIVPVLVNSDSGNVPVLASYIIIVSIAAMYVAWYRGWLWCALASVVAMFIYSNIMHGAFGEAHSITTGLYLLATIAVTHVSLVISVHDRNPETEMAFDWIPSVAMSALCLPVLYRLGWDQSLFVEVLETVLLLGIPMAITYSFPSLRLVLFLPAVLAVLRFTTIQFGNENGIYDLSTGYFQYGFNIPNLLAHFKYVSVQASLEIRMETYGAIASAIILALLAGATFAAIRSTARAYLVAVAATVAVAMFMAIYIRADGGVYFQRTLPMAAVILFALFHAQANWLDRVLPKDAENPLEGRDGAIASSLIASLVMATTFVSIIFSGAGLTIALGLITAATMLTYMRYPLKSLRIFALLAVLPYIARLLWDPFVDHIVLADAAPFFNVLALGYGIPMLGFIFASYIATKNKDDIWAQALQAVSIISMVMTVTMLALHAIDPSFDFAGYRSALAASATLVMIGGAFSLGFTRLAQREGQNQLRVLKWAAEGLGILGMAWGAVSLFIMLNPISPFADWQYGGTNIYMGDGLIFNLIGYAYALPFILFGLIIWQGRDNKSKIYQWVALIFTALLAAFWINLTIRHFYHGTEIAYASVTQSENYTYSIVWLLIGILVLYLGIRWREQLLRKISGLIILVVVLKAFLIDMSHLEGVLRAISFIGLGISLMGIGFAYQRALKGMFDSNVSEDGTQNEDDDVGEAPKPS
ncbi:MAG: DUF2339 domain-containing protein [Rhizobiaceae bacterium]|nr:DUF2339 domain-containing protein [Rhizobiaceae bacterium]